ncbi:hypothetical protein ABZ635_23235 [Nocardiopsis sp. NPDC007018]|uniref:hypothetical protein n=1 Tax=Nocardiopsis sp. NPDC007018 TaxID=3155721 RepID=UPI0033DCECD5
MSKTRGRMRSLLACAGITVLLAGCSFGAGRTDENGGEGQVVEQTEEAYRAFSEMPPREDVAELDVHGAEEFPNGSTTYWINYATTGADSEAVCEALGDTNPIPVARIQDGDAERLRIPRDFLDAQGGGVRVCNARLESHDVRVAIFYPPGEEMEPESTVTVYLRESLMGR